MKLLKLLLPLPFFLFTAILVLSGCKKDQIEELDITDHKTEESASVRSGMSLKEKVTSFINDYPDYKNYGELDWKDAIQYDAQNFSFYTIPIKNDKLDSIEYSLTAFDLPCSGGSCYIYINDRTAFNYYSKSPDLKDNKSLSQARSELDNFDYFNGIEKEAIADVRTKIIIFHLNDGRTIEIDLETGRVTISRGGPGGGSTGSSSEGCIGLGGAVTWWDGTTYYFSGQEARHDAGSRPPFMWTFDREPVGDWYTPGAGNGGGSGGSYNTPFNCQDGAIWGAVSPRAKRDALAAIESLYTTYNITRCVEENTQDCTSALELVCTSFDGSCMQVTEGEFDLQHFNICIAEILAPEEIFPPVSTTCAAAAETFLINNNVFMGAEELIFLTSAYSLCSGSQNEFNEYVCSELPIHLLTELVEQYDVQISNSQAQEILSQVSTCNGVEFENAALTMIANFKHNQLNNLYPNYVATGINIEAFIAEHGAEKYLRNAINLEKLIEGTQISPTPSEITFLLENGLTDGGRVEIRKSDWQTSTPIERVSHIFKWLRFVNYSHRCLLNNEPNNHLEVYSINDFTENFSGSGGTYESNTNLQFTNPDGTTTIITNIGFQYNALWSNNNFYWYSNTESSDMSGNDHTYFVRQNLNNPPPQWGNAVIFFSQNSTQSLQLDELFNLPCR